MNQSHHTDADLVAFPELADRLRFLADLAIGRTTLTRRLAEDLFDRHPAADRRSVAYAIARQLVALPSFTDRAEITLVAPERIEQLPGGIERATGRIEVRARIHVRNIGGKLDVILASADERLGLPPIAEPISRSTSPAPDALEDEQDARERSLQRLHDAAAVLPLQEIDALRHAAIEFAATRAAEMRSRAAAAARAR